MFVLELRVLPVLRRSPEGSGVPMDFADASKPPASPSSWMACICMVAEDVHNRAGAYDNVLGAFRLTFDKEEFKKAFPQGIRELESQEGTQHCFMFHLDYIDHLNSVMMLSADTLNVFLWAARNDHFLMVLPSTMMARHLETFFTQNGQCQLSC